MTHDYWCRSVTKRSGMGIIMEIRSLQYFLMVAKEENITKAANLLHLTQPTLSRQIMQLEEELGVKLFKRSNHNIILTEDGMLLKRRAEEIIALADKTRRDFEQKDKNLMGEVSIGSGEFKSTQYLAAIISSFREKNPMVEYRIYSGNTENVRERIERGILDFGLIREPSDLGRYDYLTMPIRERWGGMVRSDSPLARKESIEPKDLLNVPLIIGKGVYLSKEIREWCGDYTNKFEIVADGNLMYNQAILAQHGIGVVLGMELECRYDNLSFIPLEPPVETTTVLCWKKNQILSPTAAAFMEHAKAYIKSMAGNEM